jgi:hypothetical protein
MKDEEIMFEEIEVSHTLGGYRRCRYYSDVRYTIVNRSRRIGLEGFFFFMFYYESRKRELKTKLIYENRCDERLKN